MADSIWWTKMLHKDFCAHYCEMSDQEIVADVRRSVASLMMQRSEGSDFGALMVRMAMERIKAKHETAVSNGMQGGRPRKDTTADGDIREDSLANPDGSAITRNETRAHDAIDTSANHYGDAESGDASEATTTISDNMRRVPQNEARESRRTEGHSLRVGNVARPSVRSPGRKFRNKEEFIQWAIDTGLDPDDAGNCWEATMERGGKDADGNTVKNMKAFARQWCKTRAEKRRTA